MQCIYIDEKNPDPIWLQVAGALISYIVIQETSLSQDKVIEIWNPGDDKSDPERRLVLQWLHYRWKQGRPKKGKKIRKDRSQDEI